MPTITGPWTYRTPLVTVEYPAGPHEVDDAVADAFVAERPEQEEGDGSRDSTDRPARSARKA